MNGMLEKISQTAAKVRPGAYGEWAARFAGYFALLGTGLSALVGGWDGPVKALLFFMGFDFLSGFAAACREKRLDSQVMFWGGIGKGMVLLLVAAGVALDALLGLPEPYCRLAVIWFYIGREGLSILENYGRLGLPLPAFLGELLEQVKDRGNAGQG